MVSLILFGFALLFGVIHIVIKKQTYYPKWVETLLAYILLFDMGIMGLLGAYAHVFMADETAKSIGWAPGSPFQFEVAMANLSFGVLGIICFWRRDSFWDAAIYGWCVLFFGCFVGHVISYYQNNNSAPYNIGPYIWFYDLLLPLLVLTLFLALRKEQKK